MAILRNPELFSQRDYDLIVVGGGIYGAMLALESVARGLRPLLLERDDFGAATSFNSLRIVHGGLRYLQTLDLQRHFESVQERRWFLRNFPEFVTPMPCLMPLYGRGIKRNSVFRLALLVNDVLSIHRNRGVPAKNAIPTGKIYTREETIDAFPAVERSGLQGAAVWYDAAIPDSQRVVMEVLRWASHHGADALNYVRATGLVVENNCVQGIVAYDSEAETEVSFRAPVVINAAGPWSQEIAGLFGRDDGNWFWPSIAWNMLTSKPAPSDMAIAVAPPRSGGPTYFLHPWKGRLFAGTGHSAWSGALDNPRPSREQIQTMIDDLNSAIPDLGLHASDVDRVTAGLLPATAPQSGDIATKPAIVDHSKKGGPTGLVSICGVKLTTARRVAAQSLNTAFSSSKGAASSELQRPGPGPAWQSGLIDFSDDSACESFLKSLKDLVAEESALNTRDVVFRRTDLWERPDLALRLAPKIGAFFGWPDERKASELTRLKHELEQPEGQDRLARAM